MAQNSKSAAQKPTGAQKPQDPTVPVKSSKKLVMGAIVSVAMIISAGAAWYFTKGKQHDANHAEEVKVEPPKTPIFVPLEMFTVNLQRESTDQYLQLGLSLKVYESDFEAKIKLNQPEIRSKILQLLTTKTATELLSAEGKSKLVKEIITLGNSVIGVVEAPLPPAIAVASQVAAAPVEAPANGTEAASAPAHVPATPAPAAKKGIVDVLFTSFIIQ